MSLKRPRIQQHHLEQEKKWVRQIRNGKANVERLARATGLNPSTIRKRLRRIRQFLATGKARALNPNAKSHYQSKPKDQHKKSGRPISPIGKVVQTVILQHGKWGESFDVAHVYEAVFETFGQLARTPTQHYALRRKAIKILSRLVAEGKLKRTGTRTVQIVFPKRSVG